MRVMPAMSAFRYQVWVQTERPDLLNDCYSISSKVVEKTDNLEEAKRRARMWAAREKVLSSRVWDSVEAWWIYDAFEEFEEKEDK